ARDRRRRAANMRCGIFVGKQPAARRRWSWPRIKEAAQQLANSSGDANREFFKLFAARASVQGITRTSRRRVQGRLLSVNGHMAFGAAKLLSENSYRGRNAGSSA